MSSNVSIVGNITRDDLATAMRVSRFWMLVDIGGVEACWTWKGYVEKGYGQYFFAGRMRGAHELALTFTTGEKRHPDLDTCHSCDVPLCCNPTHLRFDTRQSNVDDCVTRNRHATGERNGHAKLTESDVRIMRVRHANGATGRALAHEYGVSESLVTEILRGKRWKTAGGPIRELHGNSKTERKTA